MRTMIIAETGCTHEGNLKALLALVDVAADAGCDVLKSQWTSDPDEMCARRNAPDYRPYYEWLKFPLAWHGQLAERCAMRGLRYASTVYLPQDVVAVDPFVSLYKVAAFEAGATDLLDAHWPLMAENDKPLLVSIGMGTAWDPAQVVPAVWAGRVGALRCVSAYPTPPEQLHLATIRAQGFVGLSDHTAPECTDTGALAVAAGATVLERHIRLESCRSSNPDFAVSMSLHALVDYVARVRRAEAAMGDGAVTEAQPAEEPMLAYRAKPGRRSKRFTETS